MQHFIVLALHHMTRLSSYWSADLSLIAIGLALFLLFIRASMDSD